MLPSLSRGLVILVSLYSLVAPYRLVILGSLFVLLSIVCIVSLVGLTYPGCIAIPITCMRSIARKTRLARMIRLDITISTARLTWRDRLERLYRQTILTRLTSFPRPDSMPGMTRQTRTTRMFRLTRLRIHIRGQG